MKFNSQYDGIIIKYDKNSGIQWAKNISGDGMEHINDIRITSEGKYIIAGSTSSTSIKLDNEHTITTGKDTIDTGEDNYFLIQYDNTGNIEWVKNYKIADGIPIIQDIKITDDQGSMLVQATYWREVKLDNGQTFKEPTGFQNGIIVKYNNQGKTEWAKSVESETTARFEGMEITTQEELLAYTNTSKEKIIYEGNKEFGEKEKSQGILLKYTKEGQIKKIVTLKEADNAIFSQVTATQDGGYIISVEFQGKTIKVNDDITINNEKNTGTSVALIKYNKNDEVEWTKMIAGDESDDLEEKTPLMSSNMKILQTEDKGYITAFYTTGKKLITSDSEYEFKNTGTIKYALIKMNSTGEIEWAKEIGDGLIQIYEIVQLGTDDYLTEALLYDTKITTETGKTFNKKNGTLQIRLSKQTITQPTTQPTTDPGSGSGGGSGTGGGNSGGSDNDTPTPTPGKDDDESKKDDKISAWIEKWQSSGSPWDEDEYSTFNDSNNDDYDSDMNAYTLDDYNRKASEDKLSDIDNDEKETLLSKISPKTGDKIIYYIAIIAISLVAIIILVIIKIKNKNQKKIKK